MECVKLTEYYIPFENESNINHDESLIVEEPLFWFDEPNIHLSYNYNLRNIGRGLVNTGNSCFFNALTQALIYIPVFHEGCISKQHSKKCERTKLNLFCFFCIFEEFVVNMFSVGKGKYYKLPAIFSKIKKNKRSLLGGHQQDAHEAYMLLFDILRKYDLPIAVQNDYKMNEIRNAELATSYFNQLTFGILERTTTCVKCEHKNKVQEFFQEMILTINSSFQKCLMNYFQPEVIEDIYCDSCKTTVTKLMTRKIIKSPSILAFLFQRLHFKKGRLYKIKRNVILPNSFNFIDIPDQPADKFKFASTICHQGSAYSGHYVTVARGPNDVFYYLDDTSVKPTRVLDNLDQIHITSDIYMSFYIKQDINQIYKKDILLYRNFKNLNENDNIRNNFNFKRSLEFAKDLRNSKMKTGISVAASNNSITYKIKEDEEITNMFKLVNNNLITQKHEQEEEEEETNFYQIIKKHKEINTWNKSFPTTYISQEVGENDLVKRSQDDIEIDRGRIRKIKKKPIFFASQKLFNKKFRSHYRKLT